MNYRKNIPEIIPNWIGSKEVLSCSNKTIEKMSPHNGKVISHLTSSNAEDIDKSVESAKEAQFIWSDIPAVERGKIIYLFCEKLQEKKNELAEYVTLETGKSINDALGETQGAIDLGRFFAGEGQRLYGRTTTSGQVDKYSMTVRQPCGIAGLIVAANTPIANIAWKVFPALICGNAAVLKIPEDTPGIGWLFGKIFHEVSDFPKGLLNIIQGLGVNSGAPIVEHPDIDVISFTGSTAVGQWIGEEAGKQLKKVSLELGGKNPFVVCDDADINKAVKWTCLSAFSNAGQRCAAGSRIIVFDSIYDEFKSRFIDETNNLKIGNSNADDLGPVINERQLINMISTINTSKNNGAKILTGGHRANFEGVSDGFYMMPTIIEDIPEDDSINDSELFGPVAQLYKVKDFKQAIDLANNSKYGLTACIHTSNFDRAYHFAQKVRSGVAVVNAGTYGSEPHMPFGGLGLSGNGSREPGTEAIDIYTELKDIYLNVDHSKL